jgi:hypothetical protein
MNLSIINDKLQNIIFQYLISDTRVIENNGPFTDSKYNYTFLSNVDDVDMLSERDIKKLHFLNKSMNLLQELQIYIDKTNQII